MSVVTLQVGQCGNQVGGQMFGTLLEDAFAKPSTTHVSATKNEEYIQEVCSRFFSEDSGKGSEEEHDLKARAVMVDMEPKVIAQTCADARRTGLWAYPSKQQFCQKRGSGNNWAHGYSLHGNRVSEQILSMVQREAEKCDYIGGFLVLMSLAGGTGSGLGAHLTQSLRDEYPHSFIVNQVVWPYNTGEVIVQNYNALLTLSHLYQTADAILVLENDDLHRVCSQLMNLKKISFRDINWVISMKMAGFLQPVFAGRSCDRLVTNHLGDLLEHLVPHPDYKLLTVKNIPQMSDQAVEFSTYQWPGLLKHLRQMLIANAAMEEGINWQVTVGDQTPRGTIKHNRCLANLLTLRGRDLATADSSPFSEPRLYASWMPADCTLKEWAQPRAFSRYEKCGTLLSNSRSAIGPLDHVIGKAWRMFSARAYVHQYVKHGLTEDDFLDSFATLEQILANYRTL